MHQRRAGLEAPAQLAERGSGEMHDQVLIHLPSAFSLPWRFSIRGRGSGGAHTMRSAVQLVSLAAATVPTNAHLALQKQLT
eukprot:6314954-Pyramimonas_sp.AAC.1